MPPLSKFRLFVGWIKEIFWMLLALLTAPIGYFVWLGPRPGRRPTPVIIGMGACSHPLIYLRLRSALMRVGFPVFFFRSVSPFTSVRQHSRNLARRLEQWNLDGAIFVGHGMGTLAALALPDSARRRIRHLVSLGAPYHGSRLYLPFRFIPALRDMAVGSEYLLLNRVNALLFPEITPFVAWRNQWIVPSNLAHFGQGRDLVLDQVGHYNLVLGREVIETVLEVVVPGYAADNRSGATDTPVDPAAEMGTPAASMAGPAADGATPAAGAPPAERGKRVTDRKAGRAAASKKATAKKTTKSKTSKTTRKTTTKKERRRA